MASWARSEYWRQPNISQGVGRLRVDRRKEILVRTCEQPVDHALVMRRRAPNEAIVAAIQALHIKLLAWLDIINFAKFRRQDNLAFGRDGSLH